MVPIRSGTIVHGVLVLVVFSEAWPSLILYSHDMIFTLNSFVINRYSNREIGMDININKPQIRIGLGLDKRSGGGPDFDLDAIVFLSDQNGRLDNKCRIAYKGQGGSAICPVTI